MKKVVFYFLLLIFLYISRFYDLFFLTKDDFFSNEGGERLDADQPELPDLNLNVSGGDEAEDLLDLNVSGNEQPPILLNVK
jgi:hypothetical protein